MGESLKILDLLNKWGYLTAEQIALLLNKPLESAKTNLKTLQKKQFYKIDKTTRKNIYVLTHKGNSFLGREHKKSIQINFYELAHQDMLIKWLVAQNDIVHYQTERELKMENGNLNAYPDLIITKTDDSEIYVEFERTQKSPSRFKKKLDGHTKWLREGGQIYWITPTQTLANWIQRQIDKDDFKTEQQQVIIWNK
jgi:predicted transcriptional regulator